MKTQTDDILRRSLLFRFVDDQHLELLRPLLQEESYEFGDVIVHQGEAAEAFYLLTSGRVRAIKFSKMAKKFRWGCCARVRALARARCSREERAARRFVAARQWKFPCNPHSLN